MATFPHLESKRMYSWWWNSHMGPKNSKWIQENLRDMDDKVKAMIKLINEDADSFARRAEMYYKKRPELMKLVEEFYRAYRSLAERYDNATGVIRQAHRIIAEAFPNQVPSVPVDDSPTNLASEAEPCTPDISPRARPLFDPDQSLMNESDSLCNRKASKLYNDLLGSDAKFSGGRFRKELYFDESDDKEQNVKNKKSRNLHAPAFSESEQKGHPEEDIIFLEKALAKVEVEKEAAQFQYQKCLEKLSKLEEEVSLAKEDTRGLSERALKAETNTQTLKAALVKVEAEKETSLLQYQQYLDRISYLENVISHFQEDAVESKEKASIAESESQFLKEQLDEVKIEKDATLGQYKQGLETILNLERELERAEEDARKFRECADKAEIEVDKLKHILANLTAEKESMELQYQQCLEIISNLESNLSFAQVEAQRLSDEIEIGALKLKNAEERCLLLERSNQSLHSELESLILKTGSQSQELTDKQQELGRLWASVQEEHLRFVEAETAFQTLQHLHSQAQEEMRSMVTEIQQNSQILRNMEILNQSLHDEVLKAKEENNTLNELNISSAMSIKDIQNEILMLKETKEKLEQEVDLRVDQRNSLQQEIYCLRQELNELNTKHQAVLEQIDALGLNSSCLESSVKVLQDRISNLNKAYHSEKNEKEILLEKLEILEQLLEKKAFLENSIADLSIELEVARGKIKAMEGSYQSLLKENSLLFNEKTALIHQHKLATENLVKLSEKNGMLKNSLSDMHGELEDSKQKLKILEESCEVLVTQNAALASEKDKQSSQMEITLQILDDLEKRHAELEEKFLYIEEEKESLLCKVRGLQVALDAEKHEHANFVQLSKTKLDDMESHICLLQEELQYQRQESEEQLNKALDSQIEIFILQRCAQDLEQKYISLLIECHTLLEASKLSGKLISELEKENIEQQNEIQSLFNQTSTLTTGIYQLMKALDIVLDRGCDGKILVDKLYLDHILSKVEETKISVCQTDEENQQLGVEASVLFTFLLQVRLEAENLQMENSIIDLELRNKTKQFLALQTKLVELHNKNEELRLKLRDKDCKEKELMIQLEHLEVKLLDLQEAYQNLQKENFELLEEKKSFGNECLLLEGKNHSLETENYDMLGEILFLGSLSLIFKNYGDEKYWELKQLCKDVDKLHSANADVLEKLSFMNCKLEELHFENLNLKEMVKKSEGELKILESDRDQLNCDVANGKNLLHKKEMELVEAERMLCKQENEKMTLHKMVEDVQQESNVVKKIKDDQQNKILKLLKENDHMRKEHIFLREANEGLEHEVQYLYKENEILVTQEESLESELQKGRNEIESWETQAVACFGEFLISTMCQALFEAKICELTEACKTLEYTITSKDKNIQLLKERVGILEEENEGLKDQFVAYGPAIALMWNFISFLEENTCLFVNHNAGNEKTMGTKFPSQHKCKLGKNQHANVCDTFSDLQELQSRIKAIKDAIIRKDVKPTVENSESSSRLVTKEITLDQVSEPSSYGISWRQQDEYDNRMLKLWETGCEDGSSDCNIEKAREVVAGFFGKDANYQRNVAVNKQNDGYHTSDVLDEDCGWDKSKMSERSTDFCGGDQKVLERLHSDVQKLTNLEITVQDLKRKLECTDKEKKGKALVKFDTLKGQLEEAEETVVMLVGLNVKLIKNTENLSSDIKCAMESKENESLKRRRIFEQARRLSEKIGRLQLVVQKIHFTFLKFDDGKENKGRTRISEFKRRVLLQDYLYGGLRTRHRPKKAPFCLCIQPQTEDD